MNKNMVLNMHNYKILKTIIIVVIFSFLNSCIFHTRDNTPKEKQPCRPQINENINQYIIGYGSLMNDSSRMITAPDAIHAYPIELHNFERVWGIHGRVSGVTFLLAVPKKDALMNAVYYKATDEDITKTDVREHDYCRIKVAKEDIVPLGLSVIPNGDYWIYSKEEKDISLPNQDFPMIQSYIDVFLDGCMQMQGRYQVSEFGARCIATTSGWDEKNWLNDRSMPKYSRAGDIALQNKDMIDIVLNNTFSSYKYLPYLPSEKIESRS